MSNAPQSGGRNKKFLVDSVASQSVSQIVEPDLASSGKAGEYPIQNAGLIKKVSRIGF